MNTAIDLENERKENTRGYESRLGVPNLDFNFNFNFFYGLESEGYGC